MAKQGGYSYAVMGYYAWCGNVVKPKIWELWQDVDFRGAQCMECTATHKV